MLRRTALRAAAWGANPADVRFVSVSKREGTGAELLAGARKRQEFKQLDEKTARMALSVGSPEYYKNQDLDEVPYKNESTGEINGYPGKEPTRYGDWEKGGRCIDF
eukprot:TRINITY_DN6142_c0_g1_i1.p1 TRINITY_DN6142_c0_g1~~TRINITY_DN6142_c0_g1_i1.p1  ORF type:complete len:106 (+),score=42.29 TRINITY_DN6142_c0_g1_i1:56-373(+)